MPRGTIYKIPVDKSVFVSIVKECGSSIIKLGKCEKIDCTERTIRRSLNEGKMTPCFLEQIAKYLDVDPRLLSGELHKQAVSYDDDFLKTIWLAQLKAEKYPYYRKKKADLNKQPFEKMLEHILSLFDISISQFERMNFESQCLLQHDLLNALVPVIRKHFKMDVYGRKDMHDIERIIYELENFRDDHYLHLYAEEVLHKKFLELPPMGRSRADIHRMSVEELIALDMDNNYSEQLTED